MRGEAFSAAMEDWSLAMPHRRGGLYRKMVAASLTEALRVRYPVTAGLMGDRSFAALAGRYASQQLPRSPVLISYGASLPEFVAAAEDEGERPFLAGVARLENLWWLAYHAGEAEALPLSAMSAVPPGAWAGMRLSFHPSAAVFSSRFAAATIWENWRSSGRLPEGDLMQPECALVARPSAEVSVRRIAPGTHDFLAALLGGKTLAEAAEDASLRHPGFDLQAQLSALVGLGIITGFSE